MTKHRGRLASLTPEMFRELYYAQRRSLAEIGQIFGVSRVAVHKWFSRHLKYESTRLRPQKESRRIISPDFFEIWTPEMAYVLGLFATDGNVSGRYRASLASTDLELVEKVRGLMGTDYPIRTHLARGISRKNQYMLEISSLAIVRSLGKLGITVKKSRTLKFPEVPEACIRHFLRGCWDGDGSFYIENRSDQLKTSIVSGSKAFMEGIVHSLSSAGFGQRTWRMYRGHRYLKRSDTLKIYILRRGKNPSYYVRLTGQQALRFGHFIYQGVPESMYLKRKYEIFHKASTRSDSLSQTMGALNPEAAADGI